MKKHYKFLLLSLLAFIAVNVVLAQSPEQFKYQAVLRDATGNIIPSTAKTVIINILQGSGTGTSVYQETHSVTTTAQGVINLNIGGGTVNAGIFANINWCANPYWVKVTVDGTVISTGQLLSVPYSLNVKGINVVSGNVGIGTTNPQSLLHLWGSVPRINLLVESPNTTFGPEVRLWANATGGHEWRIVSGISASNSYGAGSFELWDQTASASRFGITASGNVGIGTTTPAAKLHVKGFVQLEGNPDAQILFGTTGANGKRGIGSLAGWDANALYINGWGDFTTGVSVGHWGGSETSNLYVNGAINATSMLVNGVPVATTANTFWNGGAGNTINYTAGNVGIGTLTPGYTLDVNGVIHSAIDNGECFRIGNDMTLQDINISNHVGLYGVQDPTVGSIKLGSGGGIISGKNNYIGIGTTNPVAKLDVAGTVRIADGTQGANKVLTSDASGNASWVTNTGITPAVVASLSSTVYNLTNTAGQYTGSYITLPAGKWSVQINMLLNSDASSLWMRSGFSSSTSSYITSPDIIGASLASGYKAANCYGMLIGTIIINNTSGSPKTYYYWSTNIAMYSGSLNLSNFGTSLWMEDQIIAYPMN